MALARHTGGPKLRERNVQWAKHTFSQPRRLFLSFQLEAGMYHVHFRHRHPYTRVQTMGSSPACKPEPEGSNHLQTNPSAHET